VSQVRVLSVVSELYPFVKTGGLADVAAALPKALAAENVAVTTLVPGYPGVLAALGGDPVAFELGEIFGGAARLLAGDAGGLHLLVLDAPHLFARTGNPYLAPDGREWPDNAFRFAALGRAAALLAAGAVERQRFEILHAHDWQAGLAPLYLGRIPGASARTVFTIHNLAFQGKFAPEFLTPLGLPPETFAIEGVEYYGTLSFLKAGLQFADRITTVSPGYAAEIATPEGGMGLDGLLRRRAGALSGILNGIDVDVWNPTVDPFLEARFDGTALPKRAANTRALQRGMGLDPDDGAMCVGVVSRLTRQKGLDLLLEILPELVARGLQFAVLGSGDADLEIGFAAAAAAYRGRVGCRIGYDEALAHQIQGGATALLVPSRFEPCGLTQLCAMRYGAVPIVTRVGGLADTVVDANEMALAAGVATGVVFAPPAARGLGRALARAAALHGDPATWTTLQRNGMQTDVSWRRPARQYAELYRDILAAA
jgi:starch synthase